MTVSSDVKRIVQIQIYEGVHTKNAVDKNSAAVVVPAAVDLRYIKPGEKIAFENTTSARIRIWFPEKWYTDPDKDLIDIEPGKNAVFVADGEVVADKASRPFAYQVYCTGIREFAVGDSPPKMDVPPPPPPDE